MSADTARLGNGRATPTERGAAAPAQLGRSQLKADAIAV
jgi:hypothetical protein